ncbi:CAP domain-containing protein [Kangiella sp. TOML190]|uniref:CAP domain-containing protein n=1 Tax=Kangiella sp. TOML190 TaxID=2931351 RepID=UPI00203D72C6|nr:CAP domain-containing protein [Kangiella sp. TOML190]
MPQAPALESEPDPTVIESAKTLQLPTDYSRCGLSDKARKLAKLILQDDEQQRNLVNCNPLLAQLATNQAKALADAGKVSHFVGGSPNQRLLKAGFPLTEMDQARDNSVEAILGGESSADEVWLRFQMSYNHKIHLLGEHEYYLKQTEFAVGHYYKWHSPHIDYWVVYFAEADHTANNEQ